MLRKTVLTTAIIGAGLASTTGAAFASDCSHDGGHKSSHGHSKTVNNIDNSVDNSCSNGVGTGNKSAEGLLAIGSVVDAPITSNICNVLNDNVKDNLNGNSLTLDVL